MQVMMIVSLSIQNPALMATKTSILVFYLRMASTTQIWLRIASYVTLVLVNFSGVILTILNAFQCEPLTEGFSPVQPAKACRSLVTLYLCSAPVNIFTDLAILVLPIPVLTGMRLPLRQKIILVATFALGIFVTIVDIVRIYFLQETVLKKHVLVIELGMEVDLAWSSSTAFMWSVVEVNVGIICACIPQLKPLFRKVLPLNYVETVDVNTSEKTPSVLSLPQGSAGTQYNSRLETTALESASQTITTGTLDDEENHTERHVFMTNGQEIAPNIGVDQSIQIQNEDNINFPDFVNLNNPISMLGICGWESIKYCAVVTTLFSVWGFSYGLLSMLNDSISSIAQPLASHTLSLETAYFGAYFLGALTVGQYVLCSIGFKATFITGLAIYGTGTLMFWPSAVLTSYTGFILSNFVVGFGLAVVETAANPFLALCGPESMSELRLLLAQGVQATAAIFSQLLADKVLFDDNTTLIDLQWTYLAVTLLTVLLALFFYYMPLPEVTDDELTLLNECDPALTYISNPEHGNCSRRRLIISTLASIFTYLKTSRLILFVIAQFLYVSAQESLSIVFASILSNFLESHISTSLSLTNHTHIAHTLFASGRFIFAPLCIFIPSQILLFLAFFFSLIFSILIATLPISTSINENNSNHKYIPANAISITVLLLFFFEGPVFPLLFSLGLRGLGKRTKSGAAYLTAAASGGGAFPWVILAFNNHNDTKVGQAGYHVLVALFATGCGVVTPIAWGGRLFPSRSYRGQLGNQMRHEVTNRILDGALSRSDGPVSNGPEFRAQSIEPIHNIGIP